MIDPSEQQETVGNVYKIEIVDTPEVSEEYVTLRDANWLQTVEEGEREGKKFFNGTVYRLMNFDEESKTIQLGLMLYADRLLKTKYSQEEITQRFGGEHVMQHCVVNALLLTSDNRVVVGVKKKSVDLKPGKLGYIGGNLNADEVEIRSFEDIFTMMMTEIEEETSIVPQRESLSFAKLVANGSFASFYFIYQLDISSEAVDTIFRDGEFIRLETMSPNEIVSTERVCITDVNQSKEWVVELIGDR